MVEGEIGLHASVWLAYMACCVAILAMLWRWFAPVSLSARSIAAAGDCTAYAVRRSW